MNARRGPVAALVAVALMAGALPTLGTADTTSAPAGADALRSKNASLERRTQAALLALYAAEAELARTRSEAGRVHARLASLAAEEASLRNRTEIAKASLAASQRRIEETLELLYVEGETDPIAVLLGASSLDEAVLGIESLSSAASQNRRLASQAKALSKDLEGLRGELAERRTALEAERARADAATAATAASVGRRASLVASLRRDSELTRRQIADLDAQARAAERASARITAPPAAPATTAVAEEPAAGSDAPSSSPVSEPAADGTRTMLADVVAYHLPGRTASGLPVGYGVVAVDPSVIPLGTRLFIPGYGEAVAADTGTAVRGNIIDVWMPTYAAARAWGRKALTVTIYG